MLSSSAILFHSLTISTHAGKPSCRRKRLLYLHNGFRFLCLRACVPTTQKKSWPIKLYTRKRNSPSLSFLPATDLRSSVVCSFFAALVSQGERDSERFSSAENGRQKRAEFEGARTFPLASFAIVSVVRVETKLIRPTLMSSTAKSQIETVPLSLHRS